MSNKKLVRGFGINDVEDAVVCSVVDGEVVTCPFYSRWTSMISRCYDEHKYPSYVGCTVCEEWRYFSNFKNWMMGQKWEGMELDKDILFPGNRIYSPATCVFVNQRTNVFISSGQRRLNDLPKGVKKFYGEYTAKIADGNGGEIFLGFFNNLSDAHKAWLSAKLKQAEELAEQQDDPRVAKALVERYGSYGY